MSRLESDRVGDYFAKAGTVSEWWTPDTGPLAFHYDAELQILDDHLEVESDWKVLDVGTGRGRFGVHFARQGCNVIGVDLSSDMVETARQTATELGVAERFEIRQGSAEDLSEVGRARFDAVVCMELFDHLPDLERALTEMRKALAPGGRFLFTYVPSESIYGALGDVYRWWRARSKPEELMVSRTYRLAEIRQALEASGLTLESFWGVGVFCANAQTRLFGGSSILRGLTALARAEARRWPYYERPWIARHGAHVVGLARAADQEAG